METIIKTRSKAAVKACQLLNKHDGMCSHFGIIAIRQLLDFIYGGFPKSKGEWVTRKREEELRGKFQKDLKSKGVEDSK